MPTTHADRKLTWSGVLFVLLELIGSPVFMDLRHHGGPSVHLQGYLDAVGSDDEVTYNESIGIDIVTGQHYAATVALDFPHFDQGYWLGGSLLVRSAATTVWIHPL